MTNTGGRVENTKNEHGKVRMLLSEFHLFIRS